MLKGGFWLQSGIDIKTWQGVGESREHLASLPRRHPWGLGQAEDRQRASGVLQGQHLSLSCCLAGTGLGT